MAGYPELISLIAPPRCPLCRGRCGAREPVCSRCREAIGAATALREPGPRGLDLVVSAGPHEGAIRSLVAGLKFGGRLQLAGLAAEAIAAAAPPASLHGAIVAVPPDPLRYRVRGFDPAERIALALARRTELEIESCLERAPGRRQVGRARRERLGSPPRVEAWRAGPREALLVDDVWTTGATLAACARALRAAGSERVTALTVAHAT